MSPSWIYAMLLGAFAPTTSGKHTFWPNSEPQSCFFRRPDSAWFNRLTRVSFVDFMMLYFGFMKALSLLQNSTNAKSPRAAEALLDVVTGKLKAAEQSLKAEDEVQLLACFGVFESHRINYWSFICFILSHCAWRLHESCSIAMARLWCRWRKRRESFCVDFERSFGVSKVKLWATQRLPDPEESLKSLLKGIICQIYTYNMIYIYIIL